jgi:excisionase family DNA binding protein
MPDKGTALAGGQGQPVRKLSEQDSPYTVAEVAKILRKRPDTIYDWIRNGELPATQYGGTYYIPSWVLAPLLAPATPAAAPTGGEAA